MTHAIPSVVCLTAAGLETARSVSAAVDGDVHGLKGRVTGADVDFEETIAHLRMLFAAGRPIIGVCASGILIRAVAPLLGDKWSEPPVLAVSEDGATVVPLLGGHHGANRLARLVADRLGSLAAITTASDTAHGIALDDPPPGWRLVSPEQAKSFAARLLAGEKVRICGEYAADAHWLAGLETDDTATLRIVLSGKSQETDADTLVYHPATLALGVGCARGCDPHELQTLVHETLAQNHLPAASIAGVFSIDVKADEPAVLSLGADLSVPVRFFDAETLETEAPRLANPSDVVFAEVGCHGVAEGAALAASGPRAELLVEKHKSGSATCAIARAPAPIIEPAGRKRGQVALVGIGPGQADWRTPQATGLIAEADELVGYSLYIDLLGPLAAGKPRRDFALGEEEARCRYALEKAGEGNDVAIICSGDAGIYAMGALVCELLDRPPDQGGLSKGARRVGVVTAPGVSAFQAAAARSGALIGHDFCAISLSDLLTPRETILQRLQAAAQGDFIIAFYNPVSRRRRTLLAEARDMLLQHRPPETPVVLASNLGRPQEQISHVDLEQLNVDDVDMLTVVLVGSSQSKRVMRGDGPIVYTPRGYANKTSRPQ